MNNARTMVLKPCEINSGPLSGLRGVVISVEPLNRLLMQVNGLKGVYVVLPSEAVSVIAF